MAIEKIVVLMLENRSYDAVLGSLYGPNNEPPYNSAPPGQSGLNGVPTGATNPGPSGPVTVHNQTTPTALGTAGPTYAATSIPNLDPKEYFCDMAQQILGLTGVPTSNPYTNYSPTADGLMTGFVNNYAPTGSVGQTAAPWTNYGDVMNYFNPAQLPVTSFLANKYAVSDQWFASVPTQTFTNRSFLLCAAPGVGATGPNGFSYMDDIQYVPDPKIKLGKVPLWIPNLLDRLTANNVSWKVYFHDLSLSVLTVAAVRQAALNPDGNTQVATFDGNDWPNGAWPFTLVAPTAPAGPMPTTFLDDLAAGNLPQFSLIEPRYFDNVAPTQLPPTSNHPGSGNVFPLPGVKLPTGSNAPIDVATGEVFLMELYNMLQQSPDWENTLFIVTYDEHGGIYDHVPPATATPPGGAIPPAQGATGLAGTVSPDSAADGFDWNVFGVRVPAIIISPQITPSSTIRPAAGPPFDHTSVIKTALEILAPGATSLTNRDAAAPSLTASLTGASPTIPFTGQLVCGPASLQFLPGKPTSQSILACAGPTALLGATVDVNWLTVSTTGQSVTGPTGATSAMIFEVALTGATMSSGSYTGAVIINTVGATAVNAPMTIPVTLVIS